MKYKENYQNFIDLLLREYFASASKNPLKNRNWTFPVVQ